MSWKEHKAKAPKSVKFAVLTISSTRDFERDKSGKLIEESLEKAGHQLIKRIIVKDKLEDIKNGVKSLLLIDAEVIITTGGTGISTKDLTLEAIKPLLSKEIQGFGELFRHLSYEEIGSPAILSRALGGVTNLEGKRKILIALPGSPNACKLACEKLIIPELSHLVWEANR
ncbi:MAG TPA: molybdenum cofactor biosynthesis protein MoaB [Thermoplasmata archaeon]|nr:molybdenum cofactor biosynthesis protein MoaB [Thermoplasmata archaeon]